MLRDEVFEIRLGGGLGDPSGDEIGLEVDHLVQRAAHEVIEGQPNALAEASPAVAREDVEETLRTVGGVGHGPSCLSGRLGPVDAPCAAGTGRTIDFSRHAIEAGGEPGRPQ